MKPARFSYEAPSTLAAALAALAARRDEARVIAGGQSLAPMMNMRLAQPGHLVDINDVAELAGIEIRDNRLVVGALTRHADLARHHLVRAHAPLLAQAAATIGHYAIRQRGTLGGSLAHADPAAQLPVVAMAFNADIELASTGGRRLVAAEDFFRSIFTTALAADELLTALHIPLPAPAGWGFRLFTRRAGDFAMAIVAVLLRASSDGALQRLDIAAGGIAAKPVRLEPPRAPGSIDTRDPDWIIRLAEAIAAAAEIEDNERISTEYRRELLTVLLQDALADAWRRAA
jgi:carbon-monoxide dehydrogenase medium subunit